MIPVVTCPSRFELKGGVAVKYAAFAATFLILCLSGEAAHALDVVSAAATSSPGFWSGFTDGLLSLVKFLASPLTELTIFDGDAQSNLYDVGYLLGVMTFTGAAGVAATSTEEETSESQGR